MKNIGNFLRFTETGTEFNVVFANGNESITFSNKKAGFEALTDMAKRKKITKEEMAEMMDKMLAAPNLPWEEESKRSLSPLGLLINLAVLSSLQDMLHAPDEPVEVAYFKMCDCGGNHGRIYGKKFYTSRLDSKAEAKFYLDHLKKEGHVSDEEFVKVKAEIENSSLDATE